MTPKEIQKLRKKRMLTQPEFAKIMGVCKDTVSKWEHGQRRPRPVHLRKLDRLRKKR